MVERVGPFGLSATYARGPTSRGMPGIDGNQFGKLQFVRARLNVLAGHRAAEGLSPAEEREYWELCLRELALLNDSASPVVRRRRRRRTP